MKILNYSINDYYFNEIIKLGLNENNLSEIHKSPNFNYGEKFKRENDQSTHFHKQFYKIARSEEFQKVYTEFIANVIKPLFGEEIVYQKIPTFRTHFPGNLAVGEFHRDRNYRDVEWAKKVQEINFFLPLTKAFGTNTIWVESEEGKEDFHPIEADYGDVVMWDASNLLHGNKLNSEITTRVSFDFRVIPKSRYIPSTYGSINMNSQFAIGGYYEML
jgi:ectoine hydroxylase-related dioxygenase (phytanoyl-CoA dioxygenase family)